MPRGTHLREIAKKAAAKFDMAFDKAKKRVNDAPFHARKAGLDPKWKANEKPEKEEKAA